LWECTHSNLKRLYVITGKGGVGKTTTSMALTMHLKSLNKKAQYISIDQSDNNITCEKLNIPYLNLNLFESTKAYVARKLGSELIASWIMKTPFFLSIFNMVPGLGNLIYLGHILDLLISDPDLILVLDSPSSGHALTLFESSHNFKRMFGSGMLVSDIEKMHQFIYDENNLAVLICSLPTPMAVNEAKEIKAHLEMLNIRLCEIFINNSYLWLKSSFKDLPNYLLKKIQIEENLLSQSPDEVQTIIKHYTTLNEIEVIKNIFSFLNDQSQGENNSNPI
jgi:arsenite-transporting ATPase